MLEGLKLEKTGNEEGKKKTQVDGKPVGEFIAAGRRKRQHIHCSCRKIPSAMYTTACTVERTVPEMAPRDPYGARFGRAALYRRALGRFR